MPSLNFKHMKEIEWYRSVSLQNFGVFFLQLKKKLWFTIFLHRQISVYIQSMHF